MRMIITKKGVVDCTSDSRTHYTLSMRDAIDGTIKIIDKEVLELDEATFCIKNDSKLTEYKKDDKIVVTNKKVCLKLLNYFKNNPEELAHEFEVIRIDVKLWKFFNDGDNCSDYIEIYSDRIEVSCQDWYDEDKRLEFHENIEKLLGEDYAIAVNGDLISLHINVTEKCQANCKTCYVNRGLQRELSKEDWVNIPRAEQYAIGGGEPAEYPVGELVDFLKNRDKNKEKEEDKEEYKEGEKEHYVYVAITTNGQKIIDFGENLPDKIAVSIDGLIQEEHNNTHNTDLKTAEKAVNFYKSKGIKICINHILHRQNIENVEKFINFWVNKKGFEINLILFIGDDDLKPTFHQLLDFKNYFDDISDDRIYIDSCMAGLLNIMTRLEKKYLCQQGLYSKYYIFGGLNPCSHSINPYPRCSVMEDYIKYFFNSLRPIVFIYDKDGTSGAHEWAFKIGQQGKIIHKLDKPLRKDKIYIITYEEEKTIVEDRHVVFFSDKMPYWIICRHK